MTVSSSEQHKNLYVVGGNVLVNSNTTGDLIVAGGNVTIEGTVEGDIMVAGGTVYINGAVGGDVRAVGGTLTLNSSVGGDVVVAGGTLIANEKATVGGDLYAAGGEMTLLGAVAGQVRVRADRLTINAAMPGNVELKAMQSISFGGKTVFGNVAKYKAPAEAQVENGASLGRIVGYNNRAPVGAGYANKNRLIVLLYLSRCVNNSLNNLSLDRLFDVGRVGLGVEYFGRRYAGDVSDYRVAHKGKNGILCYLNL